MKKSSNRKRLFATFLVLSFMGLLVFQACRRQEALFKSNPIDVNEVKVWLHENGESYKNESLTLNIDGQPITGVLNWSRATQYPWNGRDYIDVPFEFGNQRYLARSGDIPQTAFNLVIRRKDNTYEGAIRKILIDANVKDFLSGNNVSDLIVQEYKLLNGEDANTWISEAGFTNTAAAKRTEESPELLAQLVKNNSVTIRRTVQQLVCKVLIISSFNYSDGGTVVCRVVYSIDCYIDNGTGGGIGSGTGSVGGGTTGGGSSSSYPPVTSNQLPVTNIDTTIKYDPCAQARLNDSLAKDILSGWFLNQTAADTTSFKMTLNAFHSLAKMPGDTFERAIAVQAQILYPGNGALPDVDVKTTQINTGSATSVAMPQSDAGWVRIAGIHSHTSTAYTAPSARDIYSFYNANKDNPNYRYQFVFAADGSRYVMTITDPVKFRTFIDNHPESAFVDADNEWDKATPLGTEYEATIRYLKKQGLTKNDVYEKAFAYTISSNDMGISLSKADSNGNYKGVFVNKDAVQDKTGYNKVTSTNDCNLKN